MDPSTAPALPEPDRLERLVTLVDAACAHRGWHSPHLLIKVESTGDPETFDLGFKELPDGSHPADELWGFEAPPSWLACGVVSYGWCSPLDPSDGVERYGPVRPSRHPERERIRATIIVDRAGRQAASAVLEGGTCIDEPGEGLIGDVLLRCMGAPTAPPPPLRRLVDTLWLHALATEPAVGPMTWKRARAMRPARSAGASTWAEVRKIAHSTGRWPYADGWMDDGMFARELLASLPTVGDLLERIDGRLAPTTARRVRAEVSAWL